MDLVVGVAPPPTFQGVPGVVLGRAHVRVGAGVGLHLVPAAAQEFVHGHAERARLQVPQCHVEHADQVLIDVGDPEPMPEPLPVEGVLADDERPDASLQHRALVGQQTIPVTVAAPAQVVALHPLVGEHLGQRLDDLCLRLQFAVAELTPAHPDGDPL
jgi:hypothetical protein